MDSGKLVKSTPKLLLLKDYLLDDFSSCSSNGFRSYPRRQCCTTVRFLLEIDVKKNNKQGTCKKKPPKLIKNPQNQPKSSSPKLSPLQKASLAVINAVKYFPFPKSLSTQNHSKTKLSLIPRSLSKKLLKRTFWKKNDLKEIEPSKKRQEMVVVAELSATEKSNHPILSPAKMVAVESNSSVTDSSKKSDSWSDSDFTVTTTSDNSYCAKDDVVSRGEIAGESVGDDCESMEARTTTTTMSSVTNSITNSEKTWTNEEKEQFSPVSILDCPFDDEDEVSSPFRHRLSPAQGATKKIKKKLQSFERLGQVEPMNLEKKIIEHIATSDSEEEHSALSEAEEEYIVDQSLNLLQLLKASNPSYNSSLNADKLLSSFFRERLTFYGLGQDRIDNEFLLKEATNWVNGLVDGESAWDWKVQKNRQAYIREMEMSGEWKSLDEEIEEIALELETKVFASVIDEVMDNLVD